MIEQVKLANSEIELTREELDLQDCRRGSKESADASEVTVHQMRLAQRSWIGLKGASIEPAVQGRPFTLLRALIELDTR